MKRHLSFILACIFLTACNGIGTAVFDEVAVGTGGEDRAVSFSGISSISGKTDSTATIHWTANASAVQYELYNNASLLQTVNGQASNSLSLSGLTPSGTYRFRIRLRTSEGKSDGNTNDVQVIMDSSPGVPSSVALFNPSYSPAMIGTPTLRVSGVKSGDTVKLFSDSTCTTQVASGTAAGTSVDLTTTNLVAGSYSFYAKAIGVASNASACSTANVSYVRHLCPSNYIAVPHNNDLGVTEDFCVAKYEMKNVAGVATSQASGTPWVSITQTTSITTCAALNAINGVANKYFLISNEEWMTIARNIELIDDNWSPVGGFSVAGSGVLGRGHTDNTPGNALSASTDDDPYSGTGNTSAQAGNSGWEQRRILELSNGEVIWDFAGNVWEWVNLQVTPAKKPYQLGFDNTIDRGWKEWKLINTLIGENPTDEMPPEKWASSFVWDFMLDQLQASPLDGNSGLGRYYAGTNLSGGAARRGGLWDYGTNAGAFALSLYASAGDWDTSFGFRCVFRP